MSSTQVVGLRRGHHPRVPRQEVRDGPLRGPGHDALRQPRHRLRARRAAGQVSRAARAHIDRALGAALKLEEKIDQPSAKARVLGAVAEAEATGHLGDASTGAALLKHVAEVAGRIYEPSAKAGFTAVSDPGNSAVGTLAASEGLCRPKCDYSGDGQSPHCDLTNLARGGRRQRGFGLRRLGTPWDRLTLAFWVHGFFEGCRIKGILPIEGAGRTNKNLYARKAIRKTTVF